MKRIYKILSIWILTTACLFLLKGTSFSQERDFVKKTLKSCFESYSKVEDYTCLLHKKELVDGKIKEQTNIICKFKKPLSVYMKWTKGKGKGTETIYVKGKYNDKLVVHLGILKGFKMSIDPEGKFAMKGNRHSIKEAHIGHILDLIKKNYEMSVERGEGSITFEGEEKLDGRETLLFKALFPENKGYYGHKMFIYIDKPLQLPVKTVVYGWDGSLWEMYHYSNIKVNVGLRSRDFDIENKEYGF